MMRILLQLSWKAGLKDPNIKGFKRIMSILSNFISILDIFSSSGTLSIKLTSIFFFMGIYLLF
jgi:hypothetical protein